jgi:hypothetical protein
VLQTGPGCRRVLGEGRVFTTSSLRLNQGIGAANQHDIRINVRRIGPFAPIRLWSHDMING